MTSYLFKPGHPHANRNGFVSKDDYFAHKFYTEEDKRMFRGNEPVSVHYISDEMPSTRHMACPLGHKPYTSKKKFRDETRARGCIEIGNETIKPRKPIELDRRERREMIRQTIRDYKDNKVPEAERAIAKKTVEIANYQARNGVRKA